MGAILALAMFDILRIHLCRRSCSRHPDRTLVTLVGLGARARVYPKVVSSSDRLGLKAHGRRLVLAGFSVLLLIKEFDHGLYRTAHK